MRLDEEADTAGAVYYLGWIKEKEEKRDRKLSHFPFFAVQPVLLQICKHKCTGRCVCTCVINRGRLECFYPFQKAFIWKSNVPCQ